MKKKTVITTEKYEVWVIRPGSATTTDHGNTQADSTAETTTVVGKDANEEKLDEIER